MQIDKINNAVLIPLRGQYPICDIELVQEDSGIWKGTTIPFAGMKSNDHRTVFFSRKYDRENNDFDRIIEEIHITDTSLIGIDFYLIPKEKMLFGYEKASTIARLDPSLSARKPLKFKQ